MVDVLNKLRLERNGGHGTDRRWSSICVTAHVVFNFKFDWSVYIIDELVMR